MNHAKTLSSKAPEERPDDDARLTSSALGDPSAAKPGPSRIDRKTLVVWASFCLALVLLIAFNMK